MTLILSAIIAIVLILAVVAVILARTKPEDHPSSPAALPVPKPARNATPPAPPFTTAPSLLSSAELEFLAILDQIVTSRPLCAATGPWARIFIQVPLITLVEFPQLPSGEATTWRNRIDRKRLDFVLCDPDTLRPLLAIELDDATHSRAPRKQRDALVENVLKQAGLPLIRCQVPHPRSGHSRAAVAEAIIRALSPPAGEPEVPSLAATNHLPKNRISANAAQ